MATYIRQHVKANTHIRWLKPTSSSLCSFAPSFFSLLDRFCGLVMPRKKKGNHAVQCKPIGGELCKESRDGKRQPVRVGRKCPKCTEMRCTVHCRCGRRGVSRAMKKAKVAPSRTVKVAKPKQDERSSRVVLPLVQVREEPRFPVEVLGATAFWGSALKEVAAAKSTIFLGSLCYDNCKLQTQLLAALRRAVKVEVILDRALFRSGNAPRAAERVAKLKEKGAKIYLASGRSYRAVFGRDGQPGNYHVKALVVDGSVSFVGSPNASNNSCVNGELAYKVSGKAVAKDTYDMAWAEAMRVETY